MPSYKLEIQYDGTNYNGWQIQKGQSNAHTIQGEIESKLRELIKENDFKILASGRTDSGVHANQQFIKLDVQREYPLTTFLKGLEGVLPQDIRIVNAQVCDPSFHPVAGTKNKEYRYYFDFASMEVFFRRYVTFFKNEPIELEVLQKLAKKFEGRHDFQNFMCVGTPVKTTVREIFSCTVEKEVLSVGPEIEREVFVLKVVGSGFLKQMVRLIVGSVIYVGQGKADESAIDVALADGEFKRPWFVAPPEGLFLHRVSY